MPDAVGEAMNAERAWAAMTDEQRAALEESVRGPETLSQALARAQAQAIGQLRERVKRYLADPLPRQGAQARGKLCSHCRDAPRYPDYRCAEHTAYLPEGGAAARAVDSDAPRYLELWGAFFARVGSILRT